jgi:hypothetical protein
LQGCNQTIAHTLYAGVLLGLCNVAAGAAVAIALAGATRLTGRAIWKRDSVRNGGVCVGLDGELH